MLKKQIGHLVTVSLKYFFDIDYVFCHHALLMSLVAMGIFKLLFKNIASGVRDGIETVHEDYLVIKGSLSQYRKQWQASEFRDHIRYSIRMLNNMFTAPFSRWRLD